MLAKPETVKVSLPDGSHTAINIFHTQSENPKAVIVIFPAMGVKGNYYRHYARTLAAENINVVTIDHRGHGGSGVRPSREINFGYREQVEMEYPSIINRVKEIFPLQKIIVMGHSLGGQMGSMFISRYPELVDGFILNASCSVYYKGWREYAAGILAFAKFCDLLAKALGYYPGNKVKFGGREARGIIKDWYHTARTGNFSATGSHYNYNEAMHRCKTPILALTYQGDSSAPPAALKNLLNKFVSAEKEYHHVLNPAFPKEKYDHYSWVKKPEISLEVINKWVQKIALHH